MKQINRGRLAFSLSVLLHAALLTGIGWLSPFAAAPPPLAPLEFELINADLAQTVPFPVPAIPNSSPNLSSTTAMEPAITPFVDRPPGPVSSDTAMNTTSDSIAGSANRAGEPAPVRTTGGDNRPGAANNQAALFQSLLPPRLLSKVEPSYPEEARRQGLEGRVVVRLEVGINGLPEAVTIQQSSGQRSLDAAALDAVRHWRFIPAKDASGTPVLSVTTVPVVFKLNESKLPL